jgi:hypothetical protein
MNRTSKRISDDPFNLAPQPAAFALAKTLPRSDLPFRAGA